MKPGCEEKLESPNVSVQDTFPFNIMNLKVGTKSWNQEVCYQCKSNNQTINYDNWMIGFCPGPTDKYVEQQVHSRNTFLDVTDNIKYNHAISCFSLAI